MSKITGVDVLLKLNNSVQEIRLSGNVGAETYKLTFAGQTTANITESDNAAAVQAALELLSNIDSGDIVVTGTASSDYEVAFQGQYLGQSVPLMTSSDETALLVVTINNEVFEPTLTGSVIDLADLISAKAVAYFGTHAFVATNTGITSIDISTPATPVVDDVFTDAALTAARYMAIGPSGDYLYVASLTNDSIVVVNISNPSAMALEGSLADAVNIPTPTYLIINADETRAYLTLADNNGFAIVNISSPAAPSFVGGITGDAVNFDDARGITLNESRNALIIAASDIKAVTVVDISTEAVPIVLGKLIDTINFLGIRSVDLIDANTVITGGSLVATVDITNLSNPIFIDSYTDAFISSIPNLKCANSGIVIAADDTASGVFIFDISNKTDIKLIGKYINSALLTNIQDLAIDGDSLYLPGFSDAAFVIVDWAVLAATLIKVAAQTNLSLNYPTEAADCTNKDSNNWHEELLTIRNWTIEDSQYVVYDDAGYIALEKAQATRTQLNVYVVLPGGSKRYGTANLTSMSTEFPHDGVITSPISLTGTGSLKRI